MAVKSIKIPKTFGACADRLYDIRAELSEIRKELEQRTEALQAEQKALEQHVISNMEKGDQGGIGARAKVEIKVSQEPQVQDRDLFEKYILKTKDFSLLPLTPNKAAIKERWNDGKQVPGIGAFGIVKVSVTKR